LVAHPDDESISASFFLQRQKNVYVAFATSGGYTTDDRLQKLGLANLSVYASAREGEALQALREVAPVERRFLRFPDGILHRRLDECFTSLCDIKGKRLPVF
jgi:LmbE family N-acetylglucosaminyl deacetylase